jgi:hypothetical protein
MDSPFADPFREFGSLLVSGCLVLAIFAAIVPFRSKRLAVRILSGFAAMLLLLCAAGITVINPGILDARFRAYQRFYSDISPGMSREQVIALRERHYPASGPRNSPELFEQDGSFYFFMDREGAREPNCEGIFLTMSNNTVIGKHYSPD